MMLVYSQKITNRLRYTLELVLGKLLGLNFQLTSDTEAYLNFKGAILNYSHKALRENELLIPPSGFLEMRGVKPLVPGVKIINGLSCLFPSSRAGTPLGFDPFSASFYLVSRYEEYLPFKGDEFGRFEATQSLAFKNGFLDVPVVNYYALRIAEALEARFPFIEFAPRQFSFFPTYDIDVAYAYKGRGWFRTFGGVVRSFFSGDFSSIGQRFRVLMNQQKDPFDTYDYQLEMHKRYGLKAYYFFLCGHYGPYDKNISYYSASFQRLVKKINDYAYTGVHPSFQAQDDEKRLSEETQRMKELINRDVRYSRQHYLRLSFPHTYRNLLKNDITNDFSMGYASQMGYRAGICSPFFFYDIEKELPTRLRIFPIAFMDGTLRDYMNLKPQQAMEVIEGIIREIKSLRGVFVSLWHNESLCECGRWKGWRQVYENMMALAGDIQAEES